MTMTTLTDVSNNSLSSDLVDVSDYATTRRKKHRKFGPIVKRQCAKMSAKPTKKK